MKRNARQGDRTPDIQIKSLARLPTVLDEQYTNTLIAYFCAMNVICARNEQSDRIERIEQKARRKKEIER